MNLADSFLLFFSVVAGGALPLLFNINSRVYLQMALSFGGAYLFSITALHLMPETFSHSENQIGYWVLAGFFLQLILEQFSKGVEHGHIHPHKSARAGFALQVMLGLSIHAFIEGLPLTDYSGFHEQMHPHSHGHNHLLFGIMLHHLPAAFALALLLKHSGYSVKWVWICLLIFALMSPLGAWVGTMLDLNLQNFKALMAVVIGTFLHISTTILFEMEEGGHHHISYQKLGAILAGLAIAVLLT